MTYQTTNQSYLSPEHDPSQQVSTAHEIFFSRAGALTRARAIKEASVRMVLGELRSIESAQPRETRRIESDTSLTAATPRPKSTEISTDLTAREEEIRKQVDSVFEELDADNFMHYEELV